jgi:hypothetical protein
MDLGEVVGVLAALAQTYFVWKQNQIFRQQNEIFRQQGGVMMSPDPSSAVQIRSYWPMVTMAFLTILTWSAVGYDVYDRHHPPPSVAIVAYGMRVNGEVYGVYDDTPLVSQAAKYNMILLCRVNDDSVDIMQDTRFEKSKTFQITGSPRTVEIQVSNEFLKRLVPAGGYVWVYLLEIPKDITPEEITTPNDLTRQGAKVLDHRAFLVTAGSVVPTSQSN